jgi:hypothetical protein
LNDVTEHNLRYSQGLETFEKKIHAFSDQTYEEFIAIRGMRNFDP